MNMHRNHALPLPPAGIQPSIPGRYFEAKLEAVNRNFQ
jgi:hypothetical protein